MKKMRRLLALVVVLGLVLAAFGGCTPQPADPGTGSGSQSSSTSSTSSGSGGAKTGVIKIGTIQDLTGPGSVLGTATLQGHEIAIKDINDAGGVTIGDTKYTVELISYDCKSDPQEAISSLQRLAEVDKVSIVLGPSLSNVGLATAEYTEKYQISFLGQFGDPRCMLGENLDSLNKYMFLMQPSSHQSAIISGAYMMDKLGYKKPGVLIAQDHSYCSSQANAFIDYCKSIGVEVVAVEYNKQADIDMKSQLTKLKNSGCDFIFNANPTQPLVISTSQKYQLGIDMPQTGSLDFSSPFATLVSSPEMASNIYFASNADYGDEEFLALNEKCKAAYKQDATVKTAMGYDQVTMAIAAIKNAGSTDRNAVRDAVEKLENVDTIITDNFTMDPETHMPKGLQMCIYNIEKGEYIMKEWFVPEALK